MDDKPNLVSRHGADDSPVEDGAIPNPGQLLARILDANEAMRIKICTRMLNADAESHRCIRENHLGELEFNQQRIVQLQQIIDRLRIHVIQKIDEWSNYPPELDDTSKAISSIAYDKLIENLCGEFIDVDSGVAINFSVAIDTNDKVVIPPTFRVSDVSSGDRIGDFVITLRVDRGMEDASSDQDK